MASQDPYQSRTKEKTAPRRGAPVGVPAGVLARPASEPEKKPEKKLEPSVVVAIISAIVTLVTALLSSPLLLTFINNNKSEANTASIVGISNTYLPENTPISGLGKGTKPSTETVESAFASPTSEQANVPVTTAPFETPLLTTATLPPENAIAPTEVPALFSCLSAETWFPYPATLNPPVSNGCWDLAEWGFATEQGQLSLVYSPKQDQQRGIYIPASGNVDIHFVLQMNEFRVKGKKGAFLHFGLVQNDPFSNFNGGFLSYQQPTPGADSPIRILVSGNNQATQNVATVDKGLQQDVLLSIQENVLTVYLDGQPVGDPVKLPAGDRAFWIGYILPSKAEVDVIITGFTIEVR